MKNLIENLKNTIIVGLTAMSFIVVSSCRKEAETPQPTGTIVQPAEPGAVPQGFYLLNEGTMGNNNVTLDYMDYTAGTYARNIYSEANPSVIKELGDIGTDIKIYGSKMYAVINGSNRIEVMDAKTAKSIASVNIPNCRYVTFAQGKAYVTSYATSINAPVMKGYVAVIDTAGLTVTAEITVGYQPEEAAVVNGKLYVANSGGYMAPDYDNTISVIDLSTNQVVGTINAAVNLNKLKAGTNGNIYVSSRGDYFAEPSKLIVVNTVTNQVTATIDTPVEDFFIDGDYIYAYSYDYFEGKADYKVIDTKTNAVTDKKIITDDADIKIPAGIFMNPSTKEIIITDAGDFVTPGKIYCFTSSGKLKWSTATGINPAHLVFYQHFLS